jgi:hypothetical protein
MNPHRRDRSCSDAGGGAPGSLLLLWEGSGGVTDSGWALVVVFTTRGDLVRVISVRDMSRREREAYEQAKQG